MPIESPSAGQIAPSRPDGLREESELGWLAQELAHDFSNILTSVTGHVELARRRLATPTAAGEHLAQVDIAIERARQLLSRLRDFPCRFTPRRTSTLQEVVREAADLVSSTLPENVELCLKIDESAPPVLADDTQIHQLVTNLAHNACHAMAEEGGRLEITLEEADSALAGEPRLGRSRRCLRLAVRDDGRGIEPQVLNRIFEPGFTTRPGQGSGLGLASVASIVRHHEAAIRVDSWPGVGTDFEVFFPLRG